MRWRLAVIGSPIAHSLSPRLHEAGLSALGLSGSSEALEVSRDDPGALDRALSTHDALSVTMPLKEVVIERCADLDEVSARIGGVNSVRVANGRISGRATDGAGFVGVVTHELGVDLRDASVVVRGSGGSAKAIIDALVAKGANVTVLARNEAVAASLAARYATVNANPTFVSDVDLIVNTVPAGASDEVLDATEITYRAAAAAFDVVYEPRESPWLAHRRRDGLRGLNGLSMLARQAQLQMQWWFNRDVPLEALLEAVTT